METQATLVEQIENLRPGNEHFFNMCEGGGAKVERCEEGFDLYEIPIYGGEEQFSGHYADDQVDALVLEALSWT